MTKTPALHARPFVLSIGTTEPLVAAGMNLDILLADRLEVRPLAVTAGVSAQDGQGTFAVSAVPGDIVALQCRALTQFPIGAVRIGAIPGADAIREVACWLTEHPAPIIIDPIFATTSGHRLMSDDVLALMVEELFPLATCVTPNITEAMQLSGYAMNSVAEMDAAALRIGEFGARGVLIKGGHLPHAPIDVFWDGERAWHYEAPRLGTDMRGTGCVLAMTMAAALAHGQSIRQAIRAGREIVRVLMAGARPVHGQRIVA